MSMFWGQKPQSFIGYHALSSENLPEQPCGIVLYMRSNADLLRLLTQLTRNPSLSPRAGRAATTPQNWR